MNDQKCWWETVYKGTGQISTFLHPTLRNTHLYPKCPPAHLESEVLACQRLRRALWTHTDTWFGTPLRREPTVDTWLGTVGETN